MHANNFHLIRFLAAVLVIYGHSYPLSGRSNFDYLQVLSGGLFPSAHMGVCIFFSISGYLISMSLVRSTNYVRFIWKRFIRIIPGLIAAIFVTIFLIGPLATTLSLQDYFGTPETYRYFRTIKLFPVYPDTLPGVFENLPVTGINGSLWTLAYEVSCYGALLGAHIVLRNKTKYLVLALFVMLWCSFLYWREALEMNPVTLRLIHLDLGHFLNFGMYFLAGSVIYFFQNYIPYKGRWALALLAAQLLVFWCSSVKGYFPLAAGGLVRYLLVPYVILYLGFKKGWLNRFGNFGDVSYGLYIYAFPIQQLVVMYFLPEMISVSKMFIYSLLLTLPLGWLSWKLVEEPALKLKTL
ncbi:acyltransferase [Dyadobacter sp. CY312]|uniref:acyltransferase family protein n=1 Tax=Dyadobacter sp. CY312 TaxID=2907303 RepID=UPI001F365B13|nr:acyltransferase [Dyadobacter sp. CY312]MCE7039372.1 acyltransferase [Dyadobacter sp. CY312]